MIKLDETNYIDLSYDKVTPAYREYVYKSLELAYIPEEYYVLLFKHSADDLAYPNRYDSYTGNHNIRKHFQRLYYLRGRVEITNKSIGGM